MLKRFSFTLGLLAMATTAWASPVTISNIGGGWSNPTPANGDGVCVAIDNNVFSSDIDAVTWNGDQLYSAGGLNYCGVNGALSQASGYLFDPINDDYTFPAPDLLNQPFDLGTFTHINQIVQAAISSVAYDLSFNTSGNPSNFTTSLLFNHDETDNDPAGGLCKGNTTAGLNNGGCDDFVTVSPLLNAVITSGLDTYYFSLLGFSTDNGVTFNNVFRSPENDINSADLYAILTSKPFNPVPEPTTLVLLGTGLMGLATATRRRLRHRARQQQD
jgi:hypothetical protein